jgi:hypothetical protein
MAPDTQSAWVGPAEVRQIRMRHGSTATADLRLDPAGAIARSQDARCARAQERITPGHAAFRMGLGAAPADPGEA